LNVREGFLDSLCESIAVSHFEGRRFRSGIADENVERAELAPDLLEDSLHLVRAGFPLANSVDLTGLSLEVDLEGMQLTHEGEAREQEEKKKAS
jgi:hypothetical protein